MIQKVLKENLQAGFRSYKQLHAKSTVKYVGGDKSHEPRGSMNYYFIKRLLISPKNYIKVRPHNQNKSI